MTSNDDPIVERFFTQMKQLDQEVPVPDILARINRKKRLRRRRAYMSVVASVVLLVVAFLMLGREKTSAQQEVDIAVVEQDLESMMSWQSATGSLMETK